MSAGKLDGVWRKAVIGSATLAGAVGMASSVAFAEPQLERAFWRCDYVATTRGVQFTPMEQCARVTEEVKQLKFGGDYDRMVRWWRDRKLAEHLKLRREAKR